MATPVPLINTSGPRFGAADPVVIPVDSTSLTLSGPGTAISVDIEGEDLLGKWVKLGTLTGAGSVSLNFPRYSRVRTCVQSGSSAGWSASI